MPKYLMELLGAFVLVFTIILTTVNPGASSAAPFAIGAALAIMIYAGGHVSGGHYNPAVTAAVVARGACKVADAAPYIVAQIIGAVAGARAALALKTDPQILAFTPNMTPALLSEFAFTAMLAFVVLNVATAKGTEGNSFFGLAIGGTVMTGALAVGSISGGVFNPAVAVALLSTGVLDAKTALLYIVTQIVAGLVAFVLFKLTHSAQA